MLKFGRLEGGLPRFLLGDDSIAVAVAVAMAVTVTVAGVAVALLGRLV